MRTTACGHKRLFSGILPECPLSSARHISVRLSTPAAIYKAHSIAGISVAGTDVIITDITIAVIDLGSSLH